MTPLNDWYRVHFDHRGVYRDVAPPGRNPWSDEFAWSQVIRVCFKTGSLLESDELYIFTSGRKESYLIPTDADGGMELVDELLRRDLFAAEVMLEAATTEGKLYCWPPIQGGDG